MQGGADDGLPSRERTKGGYHTLVGRQYSRVQIQNAVLGQADSIILENAAGANGEDELGIGQGVQPLPTVDLEAAYPSGHSGLLGHRALTRSALHSRGCSFA